VKDRFDKYCENHGKTWRYDEQVKNVYIGGHSLGGSMALLATWFFNGGPKKEQKTVTKKVVVITFGALSVGNKVWADAFRKHIKINEIDVFMCRNESDGWSRFYDFNEKEGNTFTVLNDDERRRGRYHLTLPKEKHIDIFEHVQIKEKKRFDWLDAGNYTENHATTRYLKPFLRLNPNKVYKPPYYPEV